MEHIMNLSPVFPPPVDPSQADKDDFEEHIITQLGNRTGDDRAEIEAYLRRFPGHTVADWKAKGLPHPFDAEPSEKAWSKLKTVEVRQAATRTIARNLPRNIRQAASRDRGLIWNPLARKYRLRLPSDPRPGLES